MDYTVGSVADLITGKRTPNEPKIATKLVKMEKPEPQSPTAAAPAKKEKKDKKKRSALPPFETAMETFDTFNSECDKKRKKKKEHGFVNGETKDQIRKESRKKSNNDANDNNEPPKKKKKKNINEDENNDANDNDEPPKKKKKKNKVNGDENNAPNHSKNDSSGFVDSDDDNDDVTRSPVKMSHNKQNAERRIKKIKSEPNPENTARTIYVGNVPLNAQKKQIKTLFKKYGAIESLRFRGIPIPDPKMPKKVAAIKKEFHPNRSSLYCYIRFVEEESAKAAEAANGTLFQNHHLRVEACNKKSKPDESKAIFIGNLSFDAEEEELWKLFEPCGAISSIRIVRDPRTSMGKGFAYVNFEDSDAVQLALEMENVKLKDRELRISLSNLNGAKKKQKNVSKPLKRQQFKKKNTFNKSVLEKKKIAKKIAPRTV
ncbi:unnamed protein product [Callosobruchus maculatus]|uniref:RRM domain-containing protein n=1 Tax=Callosobruchus maculatus TaxID=64391 RepID=A0A653BIQ5_CALMS|nr:unnamed protein product [Callosobruchus maculatus]